MIAEATEKYAETLLKLTIWTRVNASKTLEELAEVIESAADEEGMIEGRRRKFSAKKMADFCRQLGTPENDVPFTTLTRNYGIRQQALYIVGKSKKWEYYSTS